jgi:hypothetical protein
LRSGLTALKGVDKKKYPHQAKRSSSIAVFIFTAKAQRAQRKVTFLLPLRGRQKKKINRYAIFFDSKCP